MERSKNSQKDQERGLVKGIKLQEEARHPVTKAEVRAFATVLARRSNANTYIGIHWINRFLQRNTDIIMKSSHLIEQARKAAVTKEDFE